MVFTGHGVGGAISHMALLSRLLCLPNQSLLQWPTNNFVSIAFEAPSICNSKAGEYLRHILPAEDLFVNHVTDGDAVCVLLNNLEELRREAKLSASHQVFLT